MLVKFCFNALKFQPISNAVLFKPHSVVHAFHAALRKQRFRVRPCRERAQPTVRLNAHSYVINTSNLFWRCRETQDRVSARQVVLPLRSRRDQMRQLHSEHRTGLQTLQMVRERERETLCFPVNPNTRTPVRVFVYVSVCSLVCACMCTNTRAWPPPPRHRRIYLS